MEPFADEQGRVNWDAMRRAGIKGMGGSELPTSAEAAELGRERMYTVRRRCEHTWERAVYARSPQAAEEEALRHLDDWYEVDPGGTNCETLSVEEGE